MNSKYIEQLNTPWEQAFMQMPVHFKIDNSKMR